MKMHRIFSIASLSLLSLLSGCLTAAPKIPFVSEAAEPRTSPLPSPARQKDVSSSADKSTVGSSSAPQQNFSVGELGELLQNMDNYISTENYRGLVFEKYASNSRSCAFWKKFGGGCDVDEFLKKKIETQIASSSKVNSSLREIPKTLIEKTAFQAHKLGYSFKDNSLMVVPNYERLEVAKLIRRSGVSDARFPHPIKTAVCFRVSLEDDSVLKVVDPKLPPVVVAVQRAPAFPGLGGGYYASFRVEPNVAESLFDARGIATFDGEVEYEVVEKPRLYASTSCGTNGALLIKLNIKRYSFNVGGKMVTVQGNSSAPK